VAGSAIASVRLPKLTLPVFSGGILQWSEFIERFESAIESSSLSQVEKFNYLRGQLEGEAFTLIAGLPLLSQNYNVAIELLKKRYGNENVCIRAHVRELLNVESVSKVESDSFRHLVDKVNVHVRSLQALQVGTDKYELFLLEILLERIPRTVKVYFAKLDDDEQTLGKLLDILQRELKTQTVLKSTDTEAKVFVNKKKPNFVLNQSFVADTNQFCAICKLNTHTSSKCPELLSLKDVKKRVDFVRGKRLCFNCLGPHKVRDCNSKRRCNVCNKSHHSSLHIEAGQSESKTETTNCNFAVSAMCTISPTLPLPFTSGNGKTRTVGVLFDSGSDSSFILKRELPFIKHKEIGFKDLNVRGFGGQVVTGKFPIVQCCARINEKGYLLKFYAVDTLGAGSSNFRYLKGIQLEIEQNICNTDREIAALIGNDQYYTLVTGNSKKITNSLGAIETQIGWMVHGSYNFTETGKSKTIEPQFKEGTIESEGNFLVNNEDLHQEESISIERFWESENIGTIEQTEEKTSAYNEFERQLRVDKNGRYVIEFPWRENKPFLTDFEQEAKARLNSVVNGLVRKERLKEYDAVLKSYLEDDIAEKVPLTPPSGRVRYLPHHAILKESSETTKLRVVLDASAKVNRNDFSLNEALQTCDNLLPNLVGVLLRFRKHSFAFSADVRKAFLQIVVDERDRDSLRYLWFEEALENKKPTSTPKSYRMKRLPFGISASPFLLCATIRAHLNKNESVYQSTVDCVRENIYMDDVLVSLPTKELVNSTIKESVEVFGKMHMDLAKIHNNYSSEGKVVSVLGLSWDTGTDILKPTCHSEIKCIESKRQLTSYICSFWDPLGFLTPFIVKLKCILQDLWKLKIDWDESLPREYQELAQSYISSSQYLDSVEIPRQVCLSDIRYCVLEVYCDASKRAYGAVVYVAVNTENNLKRRLLISKSRVAPLKDMSVPRLELSAALVAARLISFVRSEFGFDGVVRAFSDSQVTLHWIRNEKKQWKTFVENRVEKIRKLIPPSAWSYVPSEINPADHLTKGIDIEKLKDCDRWWCGPEKNPMKEKNNELDGLEVVEEESPASFVTNTTDPIIEFQRFSIWNRCQRAMAYVLQFLRPKSYENNLILSAKALQDAEHMLIKLAQRESFSSEIDNLRRLGEVRKQSSLYSLNPFLDANDILRVNSRLENSSLTFEEKYPAILAGDHHLAFLLITHAHKTLLHSGTSTVMLELRRKFWILRARQRIKSVINKCVVCRRKRQKAVSERWAPLPQERVNADDLRAFSCVGIDYAGPIQTKESKSYIALFTCMKVRAIHLELVSSLESSSFVKAFDRFVSRRGTPTVVFSDNATTFKGAESELASTYNLTWKYITERSPHMGGVWERLVRSVKNPLRILLRQKKFSFSELNTLLCKIESVINKRPLTYVTEEFSEGLTLSPEDFLLPKVKTRSGNQNISLQELIKKRDHLIKDLFNRWKREYLLQGCCAGASNNVERLKPGDVVLVDDDRRREFWPLGRVLEVYPGRDGVVRSVGLLLKNKQVRRGIQRLYLLERPGEC